MNNIRFKVIPLNVQMFIQIDIIVLFKCVRVCVHAGHCEHKFSEMQQPEVDSRIQKNDPGTKRMLLISLPHTVVSCDAHTHIHTHIAVRSSHQK